MRYPSRWGLPLGAQLLYATLTPLGLFRTGPSRLGIAVAFPMAFRKTPVHCEALAGLENFDSAHRTATNQAAIVSDAELSRL